MADIKFSQLPNLGSISAGTIVPVVDSSTNYTVTAANLQSYITSTAGNVTGGNILTGGLISATGNVTGGNVNTAGNITGGNLLVSGTISATGNITTGGFLFGNGSQLTGLSSTYTNANVAAYLPTYTGAMTAMTGNVTTTANISGSYFIGNGSQLTGIVASGASNSFATMNVDGTSVIAETPTSTLIINPGTNIAITGNNVTKTMSIGVTGTVANATYATTAGTATTATSATTATTATTAGTVTSASQPTITSVGTLTSLSVAGNVTASYFIGNGSLLTGIASSSYGNANVAAYLASGSLSTAIITTGDATIGGVLYGNGADFSGSVSFDQGQVLLGPYIEDTTSQGNTGTGFTPTASNGPVQKVTANNSFTLNAPSGMTSGQSITLIIRQDATGSRIMTADGVYKFAYGVKTLSTAANAIDMLSIFYDGTNYLCNLVKGYA